METKFYSIPQVSKKIGVSVYNIKQDIENGRLKTRQFGKRHYCTSQNIAEYINN